MKHEIWLQTSPQPASGDYFDPNKVQNCDFGDFWPNMNKWLKFGPSPPKIIIFEKFQIFLIKLENWLQTGPKLASGDCFEPNGVQNSDFGDFWPYMEIQPQTPKNKNFFDFFFFMW